MAKQSLDFSALWIQVALGLYLIALPLSQLLAPWVRDLLLLAMAFGVAVELAKNRPARLGEPKLQLAGPTLFFVGTFVLAIALSENTAASLSRARHLPTGLLIFVATQYAAGTRQGFARIGIALASLTSVILIEGTFQSITGHGFISDVPYWANTQRITSGLPHPNDLAILAVLVGFLPPVLNRLGPRSRWVVGSILFGAYIVTASFSRSRNLWIGLLVSALVWGFARRPKIDVKRLFTSAAIGVLLFSIVWATNLGGIQERSLSLSAIASDGRIGIWLVSWNLFESAPFTGIGPFLFGDYYLKLVSQIDLPAGYQPETSVVQWAHSLYLESLAERGLWGLASFVLLVGACLRRVTRSLYRIPIGSPERLHAAALASGWSAFLVMGLFDLTFLKDWPWLAFWLLAGLSSRVDKLDFGGASALRHSAPEERAEARDARS